MNRRNFLRCAATAALAANVSHSFSQEDDHPVVRTSAGAVRGQQHEGIAVFLGVAYGADTRKTRFQPPLSPEPWRGVRDALACGARAPQLTGNGMTSRAGQRTQTDTYHLPADEGAISEDCLHLNLWTPSPETRGHERRPVLLYIHGGAYNSGTVNSVLYDGTQLCKRGNVVVVTVNHRLNAFGYLYLAGVSNDPKYADSGNAGMLDLILALRWVKENIAAFGGDPKRVTIFGQSGGGAKCATLMAMPAAHGLFHRVMTMSGQQVTAAPTEIATARSRDFLARLGLAQSIDDLRVALDAMPLERLQEAARVSSAWLPVVDGRALPRDPFSPDAPPISNDVPMILGNTHDETRGLIGGSQPALFSLTWEELPSALRKNVGTFLGPISPETIVAKYRIWYPQYSPADVFFAATTAFRSWPGQVIEAERRAESPAQRRTWVYEMDWPSPVAGGRFRSPHTVDIPFFFDNLALAPGMVGGTPEDVERVQLLASAMSETLISFAKTGDPNHAGLPHWPTYDLTRRATMTWNTPPQVVDDPRKNERELAAQAHYRQPGT